MYFRGITPFSRGHKVKIALIITLLKIRHLCAAGQITYLTCYLGSVCHAQFWLVSYSYTFRSQNLIHTHPLQ